MSYQIEYAPIKTIKKQLKNKRKNVVQILLLATIVAIFSTILISDALREIVFPYDPVAVERATEQMVETLKEGRDLKDAVTVFCSEVISSAMQK